MTQMWVLAKPGTPAERLVPIDGRVHIGRECAGVEPSRSLLVDEASVSRDHAEIRREGSGAVLIDTSTNGTRLNGRMIESGTRVPLTDGDRITVGQTDIIFRVVSPAVDSVPSSGTLLSTDVADAAVIVGDVIGYTRLTETNGGGAVGVATDTLFVPLRALVIAHGGVVNNYAGDAILASFELSADPAAVSNAVTCALQAARKVAEIAPALALRDHDGLPLRMGWAVTSGPVAASRPSPGRSSVHGDAVNLAFRVAGLSGRDGRDDVLVSDDVAAAAPGAAAYSEVEEIAVKGRVAPARVRAAIAN